MIATCLNCQIEFEKKQWNQTFCGSKTQKTGCSYKMHLKKIADYNRTTNKLYMNEYIRNWMKKQRRKNTDYAKRQRVVKRTYGSSSQGKQTSKTWRHKNIEKILEWNRRRNLKKKGVKGKHTLTEWKELKRTHGYRCVDCHISEEELKLKWKNTNFTMLTRDHIIPITKGGTDNINNIIPRCVSCNSRKKDKI